MLDILQINSPGEADYSLPTQRFQKSSVLTCLCLIAVSIKIFFRNITRAGQGSGGSREALSCSQLCVACCADAGRVRESEVGFAGEQPNTSVRCVFLFRSD